MKDSNKIKLFLVDDDAVFLKASEINFRQHADFEIETFPTGELCVKNLNHDPDIIILDYHLNGFDQYAMNGLLTLDKIKRFNSDIPVIMLSSQDKIETAVNCMRHRAYSYLVKDDTTFPRLKAVMTEIFSFSKMEKDLVWYAE
jgi:two-component system, OmpR family, response regulator